MKVNAKMRSIETTPEMGERRTKTMAERVNSSIIYLIHCKNFVNATMYPHQVQQRKKKNRSVKP
jgi:hypothetical protein